MLSVLFLFDFSKIYKKLFSRISEKTRDIKRKMKLSKFYSKIALNYHEKMQKNC